MKKLLQALYYVYFYGTFAFWLVILYPLILFTLYKKNYRQAHQVRKAGCRIVLFLTGIKIKKINYAKKDLPKPCIYCSNHTSLLDIVVALAAMDGYFLFMGKKELGDIPLFGIFFNNMDIPVDRRSGQGKINAYIRAENKLNNGVSLFIFPEGTTSLKAPQVMAFKKGAFRLAVENQTPLIPVAYLDNWRLSHYDKRWVARPGTSRMVFHSSIIPEEQDPAEMNRLRKATFKCIQETLSREYSLEKLNHLK